MRSARFPSKIPKRFLEYKIIKIQFYRLIYNGAVSLSPEQKRKKTKVVVLTVCCKTALVFLFKLDLKEKFSEFQKLYSLFKPFFGAQRINIRLPPRRKAFPVLIETTPKVFILLSAEYRSIIDLYFLK